MNIYLLLYCRLPCHLKTRYLVADERSLAFLNQMITKNRSVKAEIRRHKLIGLGENVLK